MPEDADRLVLVVEDDVSVRRPLVKVLEMHRFSVVTAETADEGIEALRTRKLVAGVVDLRLKRAFGRDVVVATPSGVPLSIFSGVPSESADLERLPPRPLSPFHCCGNRARREAVVAAKDERHGAFDKRFKRRLISLLANLHDVADVFLSFVVRRLRCRRRVARLRDPTARQ